MTELILFHHAQGLTDGVRAFADELRAAGHVVHLPDLYEGRTFAELAVLLHSCLPPSEFGSRWPPDVPLQIHPMDGDEHVLPPNEDLEAARRLDETVESAELFLYRGDRHLFADLSLPSYDEAAANLLKQRVLAFLDDVG